MKEKTPLTGALRRACIALGFGLCCACTEFPHRPIVSAPEPPPCRLASDEPPDSLARKTPVQGINYTLHFLEFDDQGWAHPEADRSNPDPRVGNASVQADCAIAALASETKKGEVLAVVFVHGWNHSSDDNDLHLQRFHKLLSQQAAKEAGRKVLGFYVSWRGETIAIKGVRTATFWGRKNAAHHVSEGAVRSFFARIKALRNYYNGPDYPKSQNCGQAWRGESQTCQLRTVMMGHSFGAQILFASVSPYILETLTGMYDLPADQKPPVTARQRGIADLVVLLNPAFEASRYDPIHRAANFYRPPAYEPPLLVSITSDADWATRIAFPLARTAASIFQYPATSDRESASIKRTHGHMEAYRTHRLFASNGEASKLGGNTSMQCFGAGGSTPLTRAMREKFVNDNVDPQGYVSLKPGWTRAFCGQLALKHSEASELGAQSIVWNVYTDELIVPNHNTIDTQAVYDFVDQLYEDLSNSYLPPRERRTVPRP